MLLTNSAIDYSQRVSVIAAMEPKNPELGSQSINGEFIQAITYNSVSAVTKQCEKKTIQKNTVVSSSAGAHAQKCNSENNNRNGNTNKEKYKKLYMKFPCAICKKYGHWKNSHNDDGSIPIHVKSIYSSPTAVGSNSANER